MLTGPTVELAPMSESDVTPEYVSWLNDPETFRYLGTKFGQTESSVRAYVARVTAPNVLCRILRREDGAHVGNIALHMFDTVHRHAELGIIVGAAQARGRGYGREACSLLIQFGFDHLNLHKITAGTVVENVPMARAFTRLGFVVEGTLREQYFLAGRYHDVLRFGLLRGEFQPAAAAHAPVHG
jgi:RimJ/RimL family protein N-acetyltransferase